MRISYHLILTVLVVLAGGCYNCQNKNVDTFKKPHEVDVTVDEYRLQPADEITINSTRVPELHGQAQVIRPDGKVSYELVGDVSVAGKTPDEVAEILSEKITQIYKIRDKHPVNVQVSGLASKLYYIIGNVRDPGAKIFTGRETVMSAIAKAVPTHTAWEERIRLVRPSTGKDVKAQICKVDFHKMIKYGDMRKNVLLEEGDVIYVPPTILAAIGLTVSELVTPIVGGAGAVAAVTDATTP